MAYIIQLRRDLAAEWTTVNPILASGELGWESDDGGLKIGDAVTEWNDLPYLIGSSVLGERIVYPGDALYVKPAFYLLEKLVIMPPSDITIRIGSTLGGDEYVPDVDVLAAEGYLAVLNIFSLGAKNIYISGLVADTAIVYFKQYIKQS